MLLGTAHNDDKLCCWLNLLLHFQFPLAEKKKKKNQKSLRLFPHLMFMLHFLVDVHTRLTANACNLLLAICRTHLVHQLLQGLVFIRNCDLKLFLGLRYFYVILMSMLIRFYLSLKFQFYFAHQQMVIWIYISTSKIFT